MAYTITKWTGSDWKEEERARIGPGEYDLYIRSARYDETMNKYAIIVEDIQTGQEGPFSWFTVTKNGDLNKMTVGTLISLGKALFDQDVGVPFPDDIAGGVVHAVIQPGKPYTKATGEIVQYPSIYHFDPAPRAAYELAAQQGLRIIEQYTVPDGTAGGGIAAGSTMSPRSDPVPVRSAQDFWGDAQ